MAATVTAAAIVAGGTAYAASTQKKAAAESANTLKKSSQNITSMNKLEKSVRQLMGVSKSDTDTDRDTYNILRDQSQDLVRQQLAGQLSQGTQNMLSRRAAETASGLGMGAVQDAYTGFLGLTAESQAQQGFVNYRAMFGQLTSAARGQQIMNYEIGYNAAAAQANAITAQSNANSSMIQGLAGLAGGVIGGFSNPQGGGANGYFGGINATNNNGYGFGIPGSGLPVSYTPKTTSMTAPAKAPGL